jgi:hypothetical protein
MDGCISRDPVLNGTDHCTESVIVSENVITTFFQSYFGISNTKLPKVQGAHLPFLVGLVSFICDIEYNEFDTNWRINNWFNIIMTRRDLDATDRILCDFISGHLMHLHRIGRSDTRSTSIVINKTWSLSSQFGRTLFSATVPFFSADRTVYFIFWENMTHSSQKYTFSTAFKLRFRDIFAKWKNKSSNSW